MLTTGLGLATVLAALAPRLYRLRERYDDVALQPITGVPAADTGHTVLHAQLKNWIMDGAGHGATWLPWSAPTLPRPLSCAIVPPTERTAVHHFGYRLAGYHQLDARSRVGGIVYRICVQLRPLAWFLPRQADEPWDDAWLTHLDEARLTALAHWQPRRPTLIVLDQPNASTAARVVASLGHAVLHSRHPVRLLVVRTIDPAELTSPSLSEACLLADHRNG